ncbi:MAG: ATP-binding protein [Alphaproteobacteria bacterium]|nr:ATP-binding protein [Alphaproteobacteria bacterium]
MTVGFGINSNYKKTQIWEDIETACKEHRYDNAINLLCSTVCKYNNDTKDEDVKCALRIFNQIFEKQKSEDLPIKFFDEFAHMYILLLRNNSSKMSASEINLTCDNVVFLLEKARTIDANLSTPYLYYARFYKLNLDAKMFRGIDNDKLTEEYYNMAINHGSDVAVNEYKTYINTRNALTSFDFLNADKNLNKIVDSVLNNVDKSHFSMILHGPEGSGKNRFAQYLVAELSEHIKKQNRSATFCYIDALNFSTKINEIKPATRLVIIKDEYGIIFKEQKNCYQLAQRIKAQTVNIVLIINDISTLPKDFISQFLFKVKFGYMNDEQEEAAYELFFKSAAPNELKRISGLVIDDFARISKQAQYLNINSTSEIIGLIKDELKIKFGGNEYIKPMTEFDTGLINCDINVDSLIEKLKNYDRSNPFSILIYGPPGTGKSYFLRYLAQTIGLNTVEKKPAELFSKYQGQPAKNVLEMFEEAQEKDAMLIIDEVEGIISERKEDRGDNKWKSDMTNTFLSAMESCVTPFCGTSNHLNKIDKAILRRFVFKLHFDYLTPEQARYAFEKIFGMMAPWEISEIHNLTSGDFSVVKKKALILGCLNDAAMLLNMLKEELKNKEL